MEESMPENHETKNLLALSVIKPYFPVFMYELGLNTAQIGILRSLEPVTMFTCSPIWGAVADKFNMHKSLMVLCAFGSILCFPLLLFVPPVNVPVIQKTEVYPHEIHREVNLNGTSWERSEPTNGGRATTTVKQRMVDMRIFSQSSLLTFLLLAIGTTIDNIFNCGFMPLLDSSTVEVCKLHPGQSFGRQRSIGALAVIVVSPIAGILTDAYHRYDSKVDVYFLQNDFAPTFILFTITLVITLFPVLKLDVVKPKTPPSSFSREIVLLFRDRHVVMTFLVATVAGICRGTNVAYLFLYLEELKASKLLMSLTLVIKCVPEVVCLIIAGRLINRLGHEAVFCLGLFAYVVRFLGYTLATNPWHILPMETLHGISFGLLWVNCAEYANHVAPKGMETTLQAIMTALKGGVGEIVGIIAGGFIYQSYGAKHLFIITAMVALMTICVYCVDVFVYNMQKRHVTKYDQPQTHGEPDRN